ncbi:hypothetical protein CARG_01040 [Corynebacterium argentoratense DSM 44202]|uniref:Uncharacterized protein n=1 Tax=Corynebacterium argentoratense DSM 44202 TaxID=1348662 RepID=U3GSI6_9CORY|nr:hypothetical protein CARG_01040 [Corynebacterium argentoratense DSM 44202]
MLDVGYLDGVDECVKLMREVLLVESAQPLCPLAKT